MSTFETITWENSQVVMLEQRDLPHKVHYRRYDSAQQVADAIRDMVIRGAPAIGCAAAFGVAVEAHRLGTQSSTEAWQAALAPGLKALAHSRPTAINLQWALDRMDHLIATTQPQALIQTVLEEARTIHADDVASCKAMGKHGASMMPDTGERPITIMTHCNAGALATAGYGTALGVIRAVHESGRPVRVITNETRPYLQGARLTAWELLEDGIDTTLITDNMAGHLMKNGEIDAIVVGADRVAANGDAANKIGTYTHAVVAKRHNIPFMVACPLSTIDRATAHGDDIPIEERSAEEVTDIGSQRIAAPGVKIRHPAFDVTPAELITWLATEKGVIQNPDGSKIEKLFQP